MRFPIQRRLLSSLILTTLCLLGSLSSIPTGSAQDREHLVPPDIALVHATVGMAEAVVTETLGLIGGEERLEEWRRGMIGEPVTLYDLSRVPLFYSFPVMATERRMLGRIWVSANKLLGASVSSFIMGPRLWSADEARARGEALARDLYPGWEIVSVHLVVYSFPKIGVMLTLSNRATGQEARLVVDVGDLTLVPPREPEEGVRGVGMWPFLESIPREEWPERLARWGADNERASQVRGRLKAGFDLDLLALTVRPLTVEEWRVVQIVIREITTCQSCIVPGGIPAPGGINQFCQQTSYYCTVATGQMIAAFYGVHHTQTYIASVMGTTTGGTYTSGELIYFRDPTKGLGRACSDSDQTTKDWNEFASEICAGRPFDSSIKGHSRVAAGVKWCQTSTGTKRYIGIVDPWPPNQGCGERWDDWATATLVEHVWVRNCP